MIVEYVRYRIDPADAQRFEEAYAAASDALDAAGECLGYELARCVEDPEHYVLRIHWASREAHEQGFRHGPQFAPFLQAIRPFVPQIEEMRHYQPTAIAST